MSTLGESRFHDNTTGSFPIFRLENNANFLIVPLRVDEKRYRRCLTFSHLAVTLQRIANKVVPAFGKLA